MISLFVSFQVVPPGFLQLCGSTCVMCWCASDSSGCPCRCCTWAWQKFRRVGNPELMSSTGNTLWSQLVSLCPETPVCLFIKDYESSLHYIALHTHFPLTSTAPDSIRRWWISLCFVRLNKPVLVTTCLCECVYPPFCHGRAAIFGLFEVVVWHGEMMVWSDTQCVWGIHFWAAVSTLSSRV